MPWATSTAISFLATPDEVERDLQSAGFEVVYVRDIAPTLGVEAADTVKRLAAEGLPPLGEHVVTGETAKEWRINWVRSLVESRVCLIEALARKPA